ncbi:MAG TPA: carboxylesterase family protein [Streptosporangiaceae bacterium]
MTTHTPRDTVVQTTAGAVRGRRTGRVTAFRGVPYAAPPVGELRFAAPRPREPWPGVRDAGEPGPAAPQPPSRLQQVVGPMRFDQSEDCLALHVWTPDVVGRAPVLVWLHGGAYSSGSGGQDWYAGDALAERGVVVVSVNYRLGALGFLYLADLVDGMGAGNFGLLDQLAAVRWVLDNIAAFGGDPARVTLAGQSAGALTALALATGPSQLGVRRLILQSTPGGVVPAAPGRASEVAELFLRELDLRPGQAARLRELPVGELLAAQQRVVPQTIRFMDLTPPFQLTADGDAVPADPIGAALPRLAGTELLTGTTRDETNAWYALDPNVSHLTGEQAARVAAGWLGAAAPAVLARHALARPGATPAQVLGAIATDRIFVADTLRLAASAARAYVYRFDWRPPGPLGACHCIELPFVFGHPEAWREAPMLAGAPAPPRLVSALCDAWAAFARTGDPAGDPAGDQGGHPAFAWRPYHPGEPEITVLDDPAG